MKRTPEIEVALGARLRALRVAAGMTQGTLAATLGISFQQVQKYEWGRDRIAASTLQVIAEVFGVHPGSFYDSVAPDVRNALKDAEGVQLISSPKVQERLIAFIATLADKTEQPTPASSQTEDNEPS